MLLIISLVLKFTPFSILLVVLFILTNSITSFEIRYNKAKKINPDYYKNEKDLPTWVKYLYPIQILSIILLIIINWKLGLIVFGSIFVLQVLNIMSIFGNIIMSIFKKNR